MTTSVNVATEVCDEGTSLIPVNIDCSLCNMGFPQAGGTLGLTFFGPYCDNNTYPNPSVWLRPEMKMFGWKCPDPGLNAEPDPNTWRAIGEFDGVVHDNTCYRKYRVIATLTALAPSKIFVSVTVQTLVQNQNGTASWVAYTSFGEQLTEIYNANTSVYRVRNFNSPNFLPITVTEDGGKGDPVSYAKITVIMLSMRTGCDGFDNGPPTCGFWNGSRWLTCLQAFVKTRTDTTIRGFGQLGFRTANCGSPGSAYCECDEFTLTGIAPNTGNAFYNNTNDFFTDYGVLGIAGGVEAVGTVQQIQFGRVGDSVMGGIVNIAVKLINNVIYCCTNDGSGWVCGNTTVVQNNSPHILLYQPNGKDYDVLLYAMQFPNPNILSEDCSSSGQIPPPSENDPYWCVNGECVQSFLQPVNAQSGPYLTIEECEIYCVAEETPYWCLYGNCVQSPTQPDPAATGPYTSPGQCVTNCPGPAEMVWRCTDAGCGTLSRSGAIMGGYTYYLTEAACNEACPIEFYCVENVCQQYAVGSPPASFSSGPFITIGDCYIECDTGEGWYCVSGVCGFYSSRPFGAIGPRYDSYFLCQPDCTSPVEGTFQAYASPVAVNYTIENKTKPKEKKQDGQIDIKRLKDRFRLPCIHRGQVVPNSGFT